MKREVKVDCALSNLVSVSCILNASRDICSLVYVGIQITTAVRPKVESVAPNGRYIVLVSTGWNIDQDFDQKVNHMNRIVLLACAGLLSTSAFAADDISLGEPGYGGTGCPAGSVSATLSPDAKSLSLLFDKYQVGVGGTTGKSFDRKSCNIAIPVHVPQGMSVSVLKIDFRGFNHLPRSASSQFNVEYFFAGTRGPSYQKIFRGTLDEDYLINNELTVQAVAWSGCGADVNLRTNSSLRVKTVANNEAMSSIDSEDVRGGIIYQLQWRSCN